jgi:hypothetical protein
LYDPNSRVSYDSRRSPASEQFGFITEIETAEDSLIKCRKFVGRIKAFECFCTIEFDVGGAAEAKIVIPKGVLGIYTISNVTESKGVPDKKWRLSESWRKSFAGQRKILNSYSTL